MINIRKNAGFRTAILNGGKVYQPSLRIEHKFLYQISTPSCQLQINFINYSFSEKNCSDKMDMQQPSHIKYNIQLRKSRKKMLYFQLSFEQL